jgi:hypothetical protein
MSRITTTRIVRGLALAALKLTVIAAITACQKDGPIEPAKVPNAQGPASLIKLKPVFYFNGIMFSGTHDVASGELYGMNPDGTNVFRLTNDNVTDTYPDVSPVASGFAWARFSGNGQTSEIYSQNFDGTKRTQLTFLNTIAISPRYSPDGKKIAFTAVVPGAGAEIFTMNSDGTAIVRLTFSAKNSGSPSWSPDGSKIAFQSSDNNGSPGVWVMNADGKRPEIIGELRAARVHAPEVEPGRERDRDRAHQRQRDLCRRRNDGWPDGLHPGVEQRPAADVVEGWGEHHLHEQPRQHRHV